MSAGKFSFVRNPGKGSGHFTFAKSIVAAVLLLASGVASAQVRWEDYRGRSSLPTVVTPTVNNYENLGPGDTVRQNLRNIYASTLSTPSRSGTSANIDYGLNTALCNIAISPGSDACAAQAQGRVIHALIRFPAAGLYTLAVAHDDEVEIQLSSDFANTNYRTAVYDIPVGSLGGWTANVDTFASIGQFSAPQANACALIRMYWNNQGGQNFARLRWTTPSSVTQIIPSTSLFDPAAAASSAGCNGSITSTSVTLDKVVAGAGRLAASDQFTVQIASAASGGTVHRTATTAGTATTASTGAHVATPNATYFLRDSMAAGSVSTLASYVPTIQCTRNGVAFTPSGSAPNWSVVPAAGSQIACTITNTPRPSVTVRKTSLGTTGTFAFSGSNGIAAHNITTTTPGTPVAGPRYLLTTTGAVTTITEGVPPTGFVLSAIACTGLGGGSATVNLGTRTVSLDAAATALGNAIECTFTNRRLETDLSITKTNTPGVNGGVDQAGDAVLSGQQTTYDIVVRHAGGDAVTNAVLRDPSPTGLNSCTLASPACAATGTAMCPAVGAAAGQLSIANLQDASPTGGVLIPSMAAGSSLTVRIACTVN